MVMKALQTDIKDRWVEMQKVEAQRKAQPKGTAGEKSPGPDDWPSLYKDFKSEYLRLYVFYISSARAGFGAALAGNVPDNRTFRPEAEMEALISGLADAVIRALQMPQKPASAAKERLAAICDANKEASHHFGQEAKAVITHADWINLGRKMREEEKRLRTSFELYGSDPNYFPTDKEFKPDARAPKRKLNCA